MSDVMLFGVLKMPYEMAMSSELSRLQFYQRVQQLVARVEAQPEQPASLTCRHTLKTLKEKNDASTKQRIVGKSSSMG